jgi:hypothetical protein
MRAIRRILTGVGLIILLPVLLLSVVTVVVFFVQGHPGQGALLAAFSILLVIRVRKTFSGDEGGDD